MYARLLSYAAHGVDACPVDVEVDVSGGIPQFDIVGLPDSAVREARERVRSAIRNSGCEFPPRRITVNLAPADLRKEGAGFDLPIALGILAATGQLPARRVQDMAALGQLALDGRLRPVPGVLAMALAARQGGVPALVAPAEVAGEGALAGLPVYPATCLAEVLEWLRGRCHMAPASPAESAPGGAPPADLAEVRGQALGRRALEVAAAGGHNLLFTGPPGAGKSLLARCLPGILPPLSRAEALEVTRVHSAAGLNPGGLVQRRPFRAPHHSASRAALLGGGHPPRPGEVSLAHRGALFLDELPEFTRDALEGLRQPLEEGVVHIARATWRLDFPARFQLVAAANPCPCGFAGETDRTCSCAAAAAVRYGHRLSGPLLDRIDLRLRLSPVPPAEWRRPEGETSAAVAARVARAREHQQHRYRGLGVAANADLGPQDVRRLIRLPPEAELLLADAFRRWHLTLRAADRVLKVARTVADLAGRAAVSTADVAEALQYRG